MEEDKSVPFCKGVRQFALVLYFILILEKKGKKKLKGNNTCSLWHVNVGFEGLDLFLLKMCQHVFGRQHLQVWSVFLVWEINCSSLLTGTVVFELSFKLLVFGLFVLAECWF